jgi:hypothetical protein
MSGALLVRLAVAALAGFALVAALGASAASNTVPPTRLGVMNIPLTIAQLTPPECASMGLVSIVLTGNGGGGNDLILGTAAGETLNGGGGDDCIVGGGGNDTLNGQGGNDVLIGGPGFWVVLNGGGGFDTCIRNGSTFTWPISCEVYVP